MNGVADVRSFGAMERNIVEKKPEDRRLTLAPASRRLIA